MTILFFQYLNNVQVYGSKCLKGAKPVPTKLPDAYCALHG